MTAPPCLMSALTALTAMIGQHKQLLILISSLIIGGTGAWSISRFAYRLRLLDVPDTRSSHRVVTPKGGGIGILAAFMLSALILKLPATFVFSALLVSLISFYNDIRGLSARFRLILHFAAAFLLVCPILAVAVCPIEQAHQSVPWPLVLAVPYLLFIVGTANFYNFMDGIDGIAGITGIVGFGLLYGYSIYHPPLAHQQPYPLLALSVAFSCLGFLFFNLPRATVFMGDVGSVLLGFVYAGMVVMLSRTILDFVCMASFLFPFFADELITMVIRLTRREQLAKPHRRHLYQLFANERQVAHWKISMAYGIAQLFVGLSVLWARPLGLSVVFFLLGLYFIGFVFLNMHIRGRTSSPDVQL